MLAQREAVLVGAAEQLCPVQPVCRRNNLPGYQALWWRFDKGPSVDLERLQGAIIIGFCRTRGHGVCTMST